MEWTCLLATMGVRSTAEPPITTTITRFASASEESAAAAACEAVAAAAAAAEGEGEAAALGVPYPAGRVGLEYRYCGVKELRILQMLWPLPAQHPHWQQRPTGYLSHLVGHEGKGSLLSRLKARGWAASLSAGASSSYDEFAMFSVTVSLEAICETVTLRKTVILRTLSLHPY